LRDTFGHVDCGIYAEVIEGGAIAPGDKVDAYASTLPL
jgi:MOSC domain-containing protein YiiM